MSGDNQRWWLLFLCRSSLAVRRSTCVVHIITIIASAPCTTIIILTIVTCNKESTLNMRYLEGGSQCNSVYPSSLGVLDEIHRQGREAGGREQGGEGGRRGTLCEWGFALCQRSWAPLRTREITLWKTLLDIATECLPIRGCAFITGRPYMVGGDCR